MPNDSDATHLERATLVVEDFRHAVGRLADALTQPETEFIRDAAIQRFEFSFELAWKAIQAVARLEGQACASPRAAVSLAWRSGWVADEAAWLDMLDERNKTAHTYHEATAKQVFGNLPKHVPRLSELHQALNPRVAEIRAQNERRRR